MSFETLLAGSLALYGLLNFVIQPRLTESWNASRTASKVAKAGVLALVEFTRNAALVASVMYLVFALLTTALAFGYGRNAGLLEWLVTSASQVHETLESFQDHWSDWFFLFPLLLIVYLQVRTQRRKFSGHFERFIDDELDRLNTERTRTPEQWASLAPDEKMKALDQDIAKAQARLAGLAQHGRQDRTERRRLLRVLSHLREQRTELDYERRVNLGEKDIKEDFSNRPAWQRVLLSKGLYSDLGGFSAVLSRVTLALLSLALVGVAGSAGLTEDVWKRVIHLDDLRVDTRIEEAEKRWKEHPQAETTLTDDDRQAIQHLANDFARAITRNPAWQSLQREVSNNGEIARQVGRRAILEEVSLPGADGESKAAFSSGLSGGEREVLHDIVSGEAEHSRVGSVVADRQAKAIKSWFGNKWDGVKDAIIDHAKTYHEPVTIEDLQGELMDRVVAAAFDATGSEGASNVVKAARDGMSDATKEAVRTCVETEMHRVVEDIDKGTPYKEALDRVRTKDITVSKEASEKLGVLVHDRALPDMRTFRDRMAADAGSWDGPRGGDGPRPGGPPGPDRPSAGGPGGSGTAGSSPEAAEAGERDRIVSNIASQVSGEGKYSLTKQSVGALAEYEDDFPRSLASHESTELAKELVKFRVPDDTPAFTRLAELSVERAGSFSMLSGFSEVGGVLIGREPRGSADIRDIGWSNNGRMFTISLTDAAGVQSKFGPFDQSLVHQSLAYAADGRPVAVTMTIARPVSGLKILLHPSLVDTPLGCRVQELDRLVDTFAGTREQLPEREAITEAYEEQVAVYNLALGKRTEAIAENPGAQGLRKRAANLVKANEEMAASGLRRADLFSRDSLFYRKPEFFDPSLVRSANSCRQTDVAGFEKCVFENYQSSRAVREFKEDELRRWVIGPTEIIPWSGVRERAYRVDNSLAFLKMPSGNSVEDKLWPLDFMVQVAFTSAAINLPEKEMEKYVDRQPVEFETVQHKIETLVNAGLDSDLLGERFRSQFEELRSFAVLQRLFRSALNGNLGNRFPILKLAQLTHATAQAAPYFHTKRWNRSTVVTLEFEVQEAMTARSGLQPWMRVAASRLPACDRALRQTLTSAADSGAPAACKFSEFEDAATKACSEDPKSSGCLWRSIIDTASDLDETQDVEIAFGVLADERQSTGVNCPPLAFSAPPQVRKR